MAEGTSDASAARGCRSDGRLPGPGLRSVRVQRTGGRHFWFPQRLCLARFSWLYPAHRVRPAGLGISAPHVVDAARTAVHPLAIVERKNARTGGVDRVAVS